MTSPALQNKLATKREISRIQDYIHQNGVVEYLANGQLSSRNPEISSIARDVILKLKNEIKKELYSFIRDGTISGNLEILSDGELEDVMCEVFSRQPEPQEEMEEQFEDDSPRELSSDERGAARLPANPHPLIPALNINSARKDSPASRSLQNAGELYQVEDFIEAKPSSSRSNKSANSTPRRRLELRSEQRTSSRSDTITIIPSSPLRKESKKTKNDAEVQTSIGKPAKVLVDQCTSYSTQSSSALEAEELSQMDPSTATESTNKSMGEVATVRFNNIVSVRPDGSIQINSSRPSSRQQNDSLASTTPTPTKRTSARKIRVLEEDISTSAHTFSDEEPDVTISCLSGRIVSSRAADSVAMEHESPEIVCSNDK